jgi:hypothetical protein
MAVATEPTVRVFPERDVPKMVMLSRVAQSPGVVVGTINGGVAYNHRIITESPMRRSAPPVRRVVGSPSNPAHFKRAPLPGDDELKHRSEGSLFRMLPIAGVQEVISS